MHLDSKKVLDLLQRAAALAAEVDNQLSSNLHLGRMAEEARELDTDIGTFISQNYPPLPQAGDRP